jgi:hypothetical protein
MANSPAALDLEGRAALFNPPLKSALVAPIFRASNVIGALSVYAVSANPFTDDHQYAVERLAATLVEDPNHSPFGSTVVASLIKPKQPRSIGTQR